MDKNVGSVNLDELRAAREALDKERGIETDPNMYNGYDPDRHKEEREQENLAGLEESASDVYAEQNNDDVIVSNDNDSEDSLLNAFDDADDILNSDKLEEDEDFNDISLDDVDESILLEGYNLTDDTDKSSSKNTSNPNDLSLNDLESLASEKDFSVYDNFADFEINSAIEQEEAEESTFAQDYKEENLEETIESEAEAEIDDFLSQLNTMISGEELEEDSVVEETENEEEKPEEIAEDGLESLLNDFEPMTAEEVVAEPEKEVELNEEVDKVEDDSTFANAQDFMQEPEVIQPIKAEETTEDNKVSFDEFSQIQKIIEDEIIMKEADLNVDAEETETDDIKPASVRNNAQTNIDSFDAPISRVRDVYTHEEDKARVFANIKPYKFTDVMSTEEFNETDNLTYVLGKDEKEKFVYSNIKDSCGTFIFGRNEDAIFSKFSSILLSLLLKNSPRDVKFMICDAMFNTDYNVYNKSSHMFLNRIAKNNREIVDSLIEITKELEARYNDLVYAGVKSIGLYNAQAESNNSPKMPYIVMFINNYSKIMQFLDASKINVCLHNILKFGRLVGIYVIMSSEAEIDREEINYNLPTRICFKAKDVDESVNVLGSDGAEQLTDEQDFLYSSIYDEDIKHLKNADISRAEVNFIIDSLEK